MEDGESLKLQCSVQAFTSSCEEQSVYWFRHRSGESHPGIIYTHGDGSVECKKISEAGSPTQSCVYTLPKRKLTTSNNGTFHCAVAACGQILFTNGIKVEGNKKQGVSRDHPNTTNQAADEDVLNYATGNRAPHDNSKKETTTGSKHSSIKEPKEEDTGTYFCADVQSSLPQFGPGTFLVVEAEEMKQRPPTVTVMEDGESLSLQCSLQAFTSSCEEQSVYWFRHRSGESHPGIIYTHGDGSDECKKISEAGSPTQSCVYTLPKRRLTTANNGTFYCAVAACGQILFTNGTEIRIIKVKGNDHWTVVVLTTSNIISVIVIMILAGVLLKKTLRAKPSNIRELQVQKVKRGETITIKCDVYSEKLIWFKQGFGKRPQWVGRAAAGSFRPSERFNDGRFSSSGDTTFNLNIKELKEEDTGTYFCADVKHSSPQVGPGTFLVVEAEEMKQRPPTVTVMEDGESLTLQCSLQAFTSSCEEQSVYWFRHRSGESHPGIIYTHGDGSDECKKISEAGACGQILFTNGIKVEGNQIKGDSRDQRNTNQ
ncbi:putative immune-type receptor 1 precursor, partial [Clarias magur]